MLRDRFGYKKHSSGEEIIDENVGWTNFFLLHLSIVFFTLIFNYLIEIIFFFVVQVPSVEFDNLDMYLGQ